MLEIDPPSLPRLLSRVELESEIYRALARLQRDFLADDLVAICRTCRSRSRGPSGVRSPVDGL